MHKFFAGKPALRFPKFSAKSLKPCQRRELCISSSPTSQHREPRVLCRTLKPSRHRGPQGSLPEARQKYTTVEAHFSIENPEFSARSVSGLAEASHKCQQERLAPLSLTPTSATSGTMTPGREFLDSVMSDKSSRSIMSDKTTPRREFPGYVTSGNTTLATVTPPSEVVHGQFVSPPTAQSDLFDANNNIDTLHRFRRLGDLVGEPAGRPQHPKIKKGEHNAIIKHKAQLVEKGYKGRLAGGLCSRGKSTSRAYRLHKAREGRHPAEGTLSYPLPRTTRQGGDHQHQAPPTGLMGRFWASPLSS